LSLNLEFRPQVTSATKPEELFRIFRRMIEPVHDTGIAAQDIKQNLHGRRPDPNHLDESDWLVWGAW
jgi:hypothetical protein